MSEHARHRHLAEAIGHHAQVQERIREHARQLHDERERERATAPPTVVHDEPAEPVATPPPDLDALNREVHADGERG